MKESFKKELEYYKKWFKYGTLVFIAVILCRIVMFPVVLLFKLWHWVYYSTDEYWFDHT